MFDNQASFILESLNIKHMKAYSKFDNEDPKKKSIAAATHFQSTNQIAPPSMDLTATTSVSADPNTQSPNNLTAKKTDMSLKSQQSDQQEENQNDENFENDPMQFITSLNLNHFSSAVDNAFDLFQSTAHLADVRINGAFASSGPGVLKGLNIRSLIKSDPNLIGLQGADKHFAKAVTKVLGDAFEQWKSGLLIPNLMWYPQFQFFPGPFAPYMPNIPTLLLNLPSFGEHLLNNASQIAQRILMELPHEMHNAANGNKIQDIAEWTELYFLNKRHGTLISGAMGGGPVSGFHPPFSFGGPVTGNVLPTPGVLK